MDDPQMWSIFYKQVDFVPDLISNLKSPIIKHYVITLQETKMLIYFKMNESISTSCKFCTFVVLYTGADWF